MRWQMVSQAISSNRKFMLPALWLFLLLACADVLLRSIPEFDELESVTAPVTHSEIDETTLEFRLEGVDRTFEVSAKGNDNFYAITEATELKQPLTVTTWPGVLEGKGWPSVPYFSNVPWQIEKDGKVLLAYQDRVANSGTFRWLAWIILIVSGTLLGLWLKRYFSPEASTAPAVSREESRVPRSGPGESTSAGMPRSARWFWDIAGGVLLCLALVSMLVGAFGQKRAIPTVTDLVEKNGVVTDVRVDTGKVLTGQRNRLKEIKKFSFALEGDEARWAVPKVHWNYDALARSLVPGATARLLVENDAWVAKHGRSTGIEQLWGVEVGGAKVVTLAQQTELARRQRARPMPWLLIGLIVLGGAACFAYGRLWGRSPP